MCTHLKLHWIHFFFHIKYIYYHILFLSLYQIFKESTFFVTALSFHILFLEREGTAVIGWKKVLIQNFVTGLYDELIICFSHRWYKKVFFWSLNHCYTSIIHISTRFYGIGSLMQLFTCLKNIHQNLLLLDLGQSVSFRVNEFLLR